MEQFAASLITGIITGGLSLVGIFAANSKAQAVMQEQIAELRRHVEKHNQVIERTYELEKVTSVHEQQLDACEARLKKLEQ